MVQYYSIMMRYYMLRVTIVQYYDEVLYGQTMVQFLAPPAERQRSFSNADSSVIRRPSSSVVVRRRQLFNQKLDLNNNK